jgi:hypothetical protein
MSQLTPAQAFEHASALLPIVAITSSPDGYSYGWTKVPRLSHSRKLWTAEGKADCHYIGHNNIDWQTDDIAKRIYVPEVVPTDEDACRRVLVMVRDDALSPWFGPHILLSVLPKNAFAFETADLDRTGRVLFRFARLARGNEIPAVEANQ